MAAVVHVEDGPQSEVGLLLVPKDLEGILRLGVGRDVPEISSVFGNHFDVDQTLIGVRLKLKRTIGC